MAKIICVEGCDKAGKATQSTMLAEALWTGGAPVTLAVRAEIPALEHNLSHRLIYWMLRNGWAKCYPNAFQFVQFLNKLMFQWFSLPQLLQWNDYVVLDRWALSGLVYGDATGVNRWFNRLLFKLLRKPDITLIMDGTSFKRSHTTDDSYEKDTALQTAVKEGYRRVGLRPGAQSEGYELVSNVGTREEVHAAVIGVLRHSHVLPPTWGLE